jgi:hypothetical protein
MDSRPIYICFIYSGSIIEMSDVVGAGEDTAKMPPV